MRRGYQHAIDALVEQHQKLTAQGADPLTLQSRAHNVSIKHINVKGRMFLHHANLVPHSTANVNRGKP